MILANSQQCIPEKEEDWGTAENTDREARRRYGERNDW
jgi:hypothetical protein